MHKKKSEKITLTARVSRWRAPILPTRWDITTDGLTIRHPGLFKWGKRYIEFDDIKSVRDSGRTIILELENGKKFTLKNFKSKDPGGFVTTLKAIADRKDISTMLAGSTGFEEFRTGLKNLQDTPGINARHLVDTIILKAIRVRASDIHLEPHLDTYRVRYRIDGMFYDAGEINPTWANRIVSRIKVAAELIVYRKDIPQEGRISFTGAENPVDVRVSIVPTVGGEKTVLRVFDSERARFNLSLLNLHQDIENRLRDLIFRPGGVILLTGPASSGKTTTMYACLKEISRVKKDTANIVSIEDPVEYQLGNIQQMQTDPKKGLTFAKALSSMLRQDPEVIMVGEIRDPETAGICLQAGLTGHLVLSTIHCGRAHIVPLRLLDMGIEPFQISSSLKGCLALRLVRKNCLHCREEFQPPETVMNKLAPHLKEYMGPFFRGKGCDKCLQIGTLGRMPIAELVVITDSIQKIISTRCTPKKLEAAIRKSGEYTTIIDNGIGLIQSGDLDPEELVRVMELD